MAASDGSNEYSAPDVSRVSAPSGTEEIDVEWVNITAAGGRNWIAAVARPSGAGPFPTVILLHGTHGFAREYVHLAQNLAGGGLLAMAACWFQGGSGAGSRFITPIASPEAPAMPDASSPEALRTVDVLVNAVRSLPGADPTKIGIFGHSRGGGAALNYILQRDGAQAVVLNSSRYPDEPVGVAEQVKVPILILHGTADSPDDGGSVATDIKMARDFEAALLSASRKVRAVYYEGGRHNSIFTSPAQCDDEVRQMREFFISHLLDDH